MTVTFTRLHPDDEHSFLLDKYDTWMFDCDGVLWHGDTLVDGAVEVLNNLRSKNKTIIFVSNNASKSRRQYKEKFDHLGIKAHVDEIYGSAYAAAVYLSSVVKFPRDKKVYVIGMSGIEEELREEGISFVGGTDSADNTLAPFTFANYTHDPDVGAVLFGLDLAVNYTKLCKAFQYLTRNTGCLFLATNGDSTYPVSGGTLPGAGALWSTLRFALNKDPVSIGKPSSTMMDCIKAKVHFDPARTIMVGDRLNTDIVFGRNGGLATMLVMTGVTKESDISGPDASDIVPDYVVQSIGDLCRCSAT